MADDEDAGALSDVDEEDPLPPPPPPTTSSSKPPPASAPQPQPNHGDSAQQQQQQQQRLVDLSMELEEERRLRRAAEDALSSSETRLSRLKAFAQDALRKRDESTAAAAASSRALQALQAEAATASSMLSSGLERISAKASPSTPPAPLPTSHKYSSGLPALAYGVLKRANDIVDDLLAQIGAARREVSERNYQIAIEVSELEAAVASRAAESESLAKSLSDRETQLSSLRDQLTALEATLRPLLAEQIGCASRIYDEVRQVVSLVDADAAGALPDSVFVWKEADVEESLRVSLEGTRMALDIASMALHKVGAWRDRGNSKVTDLQNRVEELVREKEHIGVLLRSALQANTSEVLKVAQDGLREAGIDIGLNNGHHRDHRPGTAHKDDEVYTLAGALEDSIKESQIKIIEMQHLVEAQRAESGLLRTRMEGQEKEIGQLRKQIKHLEDKERVANDSVEGLMMDVAAAEEEIKRWKMAAEEEADAGRSIEQEFQIQLTSLHKELEEAKESMVELENKLKFKEETAAAAMAARATLPRSRSSSPTRDPPGYGRGWRS